jgi:protein O-mannosyl-transferase
MPCIWHTAPKPPCRQLRPGKTVLKFGIISLKLSIAVFTAVLVLLIYSSSLSGPFLFDDGRNIQENAHIRLTRLGWGDLMRAAFESPLSNRPVANMSFALNYYLAGYRPGAYRLLNILIHILAGLFLYLFLKTTLALPVVRSRYGIHPWLPYVAALIWLVHPINTQSVAYVVQRMNSMAAMFYVLAIWLYARARLSQNRWQQAPLVAGCMLSGLLALGTKEIAATLPLFIFLYEWYFFQDLDRTWLKRGFILGAAMLLLMIGVSYLYLDGHPLARLMAGYHTRNFTLVQRLLTEFRVIILYLSLLIYPNPNRLNLDYDFPISHSLLDPITTLLSLSAVIACLVLAARLARKDRLLSFCLLWFLANLAIESSIIGLEMVFEHRTYLPSMLIILMGAVLAERHIKFKAVKIAAICSVLMIFSTWTFARNAVWSSDVAIWRDTVAKSPLKARPHNNLGNALKRSGDIAGAIAQYKQALRINPNYAKAYNNLGNALAAQGQYDQAVEQFKHALKLNPGYAEVYNNIGVTLAGQKKFAEASAYFAEAMRLRPDQIGAYNNMGAALVRMGRYRDALAHFYTALRLNPRDKETRQNIKVCLQLIQSAKAGSGPHAIPR